MTISIAEPVTSSKPTRRSPTRRSKTITISLPPEMAAKAEAMAKREGRTMSELFRETFRAYYAREVDTWFQELAEFATTHNPHGYTEADIPRLIKEVRAEEAAEKAALKIAKAS